MKGSARQRAENTFTCFLGVGLDEVCGGSSACEKVIERSGQLNLRLLQAPPELLIGMQD